MGWGGAVGSRTSWVGMGVLVRMRSFGAEWGVSYFVVSRREGKGEGRNVPASEVGIVECENSTMESVGVNSLSI
jgi:hypothetical protein